ncbi:MAG: SDR family oxidoreductase [Anaerolineae bacterium]
MPHYLVTGGAGFIGSHIVEALTQRGERVRVLDNLSTGRMENIAPFLDRIEFVEGDLCDSQTVRQVVDGVDFVLHQAALPSVIRSVQDPIPTERANVLGTLTLLLAAQEAGVRRLVYASSSSVYGDSPTLPKVETMPPHPKSPYAVSKLAMEHYCRVFTELHGLETVGLRYFNVFGPRQDPTSEYAAVIPKFITAMLRGQPPAIYGDGTQSRDFTFVSNVVEANLLATTNPGMAGQVFNAAAGARHTLLELVAILNEILGTSIEPLFGPPRPGDVKHSQAGIDLIRECGYQVQVDFRAGLQKTVGWYAAQNTKP